MSTDWIRSTRNHFTMLSECFPLCSVASWQRDKSCHPSRWIRGPNELCNISLFRIRLRIIIKAEHHSASIYILSIYHWFSRLRYSWETTASKLYLFRTTTIIIVIIKVVSIDLRGRTRNPKVTGHASIKGVFRIGCTGWLTYAHILSGDTHTHIHTNAYTDFWIEWGYLTFIHATTEVSAHWTSHLVNLRIISLLVQYLLNTKYMTSSYAIPLVSSTLFFSALSSASSVWPCCWIHSYTHEIAQPVWLCPAISGRVYMQW